MNIKNIKEYTVRILDHIPVVSIREFDDGMNTVQDFYTHVFLRVNTLDHRCIYIKLKDSPYESTQEVVETQQFTPKEIKGYFSEELLVGLICAGVFNERQCYERKEIPPGYEEHKKYSSFCRCLKEQADNLGLVTTDIKVPFQSTVPNHIIYWSNESLVLIKKKNRPLPLEQLFAFIGKLLNIFFIYLLKGVCFIASLPLKFAYFIFN